MSVVLFYRLQEPKWGWGMIAQVLYESLTQKKEQAAIRFLYRKWFFGFYGRLP